VLVQVAETLNKRNRLAWEMVANVVLPQLLLIDGPPRSCGSASRAGWSRCSACAAPSPTARTWT
jgi:hypothetical protein